MPFIEFPRVRSAWLGSAALVAALVAPALPVLASTYYLSPNGNDANSGLTSGSPWATINKANGSVKAGDVVLLANGTYSGEPNPNVNGTAGARITYVGNLSNPSAVTVAATSLTRSYVTIKGVTSTGFTLQPASSVMATHDSIAFCRTQSITFWGSKNSMVSTNTVTNTGGWAVTFLHSNGDQGPTGAANCEYDTLRNNNIVINNIPQAGRGMMFTSDMQYCVIDSNSVTATFLATVSLDRSYLFRLVYAHMNEFKDNSFSASALNMPGVQPWAMYALRDSSYKNVFLRNRFNTTGAYPIEFFQSQSGDATFDKDIFGNRWEGCVWDIRTPGASPYSGLNWQDGILGDTLRNCVINAPQQACINLSGVRSSTNLPAGSANVGLIDHNTCYGTAENGDSPFTMAGWASSWTAGGGLQVSNNIFYTNSTSTGTPYNSAVGMLVSKNVNLRMDYNLYAHYGGAGRSIWYDFEGSGSNYASPGTSGTLCTQGGANGWPAGLDCHSRYGSPQFTDSSRTSFDWKLRPTSAAKGAASDGTDIGALTLAVAGPDGVAPNGVSDLATTQVSDVDAVLRWTAPGDDGSFGTATAYDFRVSNAPITDANFSSATPVTPTPVPLAGGTAQSYVLTGLTPGASYYYAIKTRDEASNWSPLSNVLQVTTSATDSVSPAAVKDLSTN